MSFIWLFYFMKKICTLLAAFFFSVVLCAQQPFEGIITYKLKGVNHIGDDSEAELKIYFGKNAIRLKFRDKEFYEKEEIVVRLDSGRSYTLNTQNSTYTSRGLFVVRPAPVKGSEKNIAGYKTQAVESMALSPATVFGERFRANQLIAYTSPDLYFPVPDFLRINPEFIFIYDNHIALGVEARFNRLFEIDHNGSGPEFTILEAVEVNPMTLPTADFLIPPPGYTEDFHFYDGMAPDSLAVLDTTVVIDTVMVEEVMPEPPPPPPPPPVPAKKKKASGQSPVRKPD